MCQLVSVLCGAQYIEMLEMQKLKVMQYYSVVKTGEYTPLITGVLCSFLIHLYISSEMVSDSNV